MDLGLKDVHILVTGASGGIGLQTVRTYAEHGAKVTAHYNTNVSPLHDLIEAFGSASVRAIQADLTNESSVFQMFSQHEGQPDFGPVQIVVINHGIWPTADESIAVMSLDRWNHTINTNLTSSFLVARKYLQQLSLAPEELRAKANIVFIGSTAGKYGEAGHADYAVTKSAMMYGLTLSLKNEIVKIAPKGRVNCIAPGWVKTPMAEETLRDTAFVQRALATTPLKKVAEPRDIANQIALISSPTLSGHVSGQVLMVDGGMEGRLLNVPSDF
ncbi:NAD-P-binding protein [Pleurotus eryngii]|uniref:NAD-P-binding protein n=1 Tax=Pleurotus eryngii TaxID=5323 RepID=A0A9P6A8T5_PLEER|nr:NAD-P-binding protein [Pleurotus eryngii]